MDQPLRLMVLCKDFSAPGGVSNFVRSILTHLPKDVAATQLSIGRPTGREGVFEILLSPIRDNWNLIRGYLRLKPDCVHLNPSFNWSSLLRDGLFVAVLKLLGCKNILVFFHGWRDSDAERVGQSVLLRWLFCVVFGQAKVICVLASRFKNSLVEMGIDANKVHVTTTMFDATNFAGIKRERRDSRFVLTFLGRLVREKGIFETLKAFALVLDKFPQARFIFAGDGPELEALRVETNKLGIADCVEFPGYLTGKQKAQTLLDSDLFVFPTYYPEGCPVSLLEAMAAGLPIITGSAGGIPDILEDGEHGCILETISEEQIQADILRMLKSSDLRTAMAKLNRTYAWREFHPDAVVSKIVDLYRLACA